MSTLTPEDVPPTVNTLSEFSSQHAHAVRFCDLSPGREYSYIIRIVLQRNTNADVVYPVTGSFIISEWVGVLVSIW